jgi:chromatin remodeling complex protein RSC6
MVRTSNKSSASVAAPAPVSEVKAPRVSKKAAASAPVPEVKSVEETVPAVPAVVDTSAVEGEVSSLSARLAEFSAKIHAHNVQGVALKNEFKALEKTILRDLKNSQKASNRKKRTSGNRQPSGFIKPTLISDELAQFLGKTVGTELARTAVSKEINQYIRANNLQDPANGRKINPDSKLSKLLKIAKGEELTYFNLQRYMKHHFVKPAAPATA